MKTLILDPGHGGSDPGAQAFGYKEKDLNLIVAKRVSELLKEYSPELTRTNDITLSLEQRGEMTHNKYQYCLSIHFNAATGEARGIETIHSFFSSKGKQLAETIAQQLKENTGLPIRRTFYRLWGNSDYYFMHRRTGSTTTIIVESLFLDSMEDVMRLNIESIAKGIAQGFKVFLAMQTPVSTAKYKKVSLNGTDPSRMPVLRQGNKGKDVEFLQAELRTIGYYNGIIDGDFGPITRAAVMALQSRNGLSVDGIAGRQTWEHILIAHVLEVDPLSIYGEIVKTAGSKIKGDFANGTFYDMNSMRGIGNLVVGGKVISKQWVTHPDTGEPWDTIKRGNLIVYKNSEVAVKMIMDIEKEENIQDIHFAISGFNLFPLNLKAEWWPASVGRITWRISLGYNQLTKKINVVIQPDCSAERAAKTMKILGCEGYSICLDSGDSTNGRFTDNDIRLTSRMLHNIIRW